MIPPRLSLPTVISRAFAAVWLTAADWAHEARELAGHLWRRARYGL